MNQQHADAHATERQEDDQVKPETRASETPASSKSEEAEREQDRQLESGEENPV